MIQEGTHIHILAWELIRVLYPLKRTIEKLPKFYVVMEVAIIGGLFVVTSLFNVFTKSWPNKTKMVLCNWIYESVVWSSGQRQEDELC